MTAEPPPRSPPPRLRSSVQPLSAAYDLAMLDLDGVVYVGREAVPDVERDLAAATAAGMTLAYVTNNASRSPAEVAEHLRSLGVTADDADVVTSAQAAARLLAQRLPPSAPVFVIGGGGLVEALVERGLRPVQDVGEDPLAVVSGYHPDLRWRTVIDGAILVRRGLPWVASNTDLTVPTPHGPGPGNGVLVDAVARYAGVRPQVAGKPEPPLFEETVRRVGGRRPLVVGDRLDTDIEGAARAGCHSLLVMTGVTGVAELAAATGPQRPTYVAAGLGALTRPHPAPEPLQDGTAAGWGLEGWRAGVVDGALVVRGDGGADAWWRVVAEAAWAHLDDTGSAARLDELAAPSNGRATPAGPAGD